MDSGLGTARIAASPSLNVRVEAPAPRTAIPTDLGPARSVTATGNADASTAYDAARELFAQPETARGVIVDPMTREVIFREISERSGEVISQVPGDAMLKLMVYYRDIAHPEPNHAVEKVT
jgi:hypothetical protein